MNFLKKLFAVLWSQHQQIVRYGIIGVCCAGLDFLVFLALHALLVGELSVVPFDVILQSVHFGKHAIHIDTEIVLVLLANTVSVHCGIFASFFLNRHFTFNIKDLTVHRFASFYLVGIAGLLLSSLLLVLFVRGLNLEERLAKFATIFFVALTQFLLNKFVSFRKTRKTVA